MGIGLAIYTLMIAVFSGFAGPVISGALVQQMGSFSQVMALNGAFLMAAAVLMAGLAVWERQQQARAAAQEDDEDDLQHQHQQQSAVHGKDTQRAQQRGGGGGKENDVELARMQQ